jgi:hypothetical protein
MSQTSTSPTMLSPYELSRLIVEPNMPHNIFTTFSDQPISLTVLRHYRFLSQSIDRLEQELERHRQEQHTLFDRLNGNRMFQTRITPIVQDFRRRTRRSRFHPYARTPSPPQTPSCDDSIVPPTALSSRLSTYAEPGTRLNPIDVDADTREVPASRILCKRCHSYGHLHVKCPVPLCSHCEQLGHVYGRTTCPEYQVYRLKPNGTWLTPAGRIVTSEERGN